MGGIATRVAVLSSLVVLVATATVGYLVYRGAQDSLMQAASNGLAHTAETVTVRTWGTLDAVGNDVRFLARTPPVQGIVRARMLRGLDPMWSIRDDEWGVQLAETFRAFLESRPEYLQARFVGIGDEGRELVRVERDGEQVTFADVATFRSLEGVSFMEEARELPPGGVYVSDVMWKDEVDGRHSGIPIVRISTPVHAESGEIFGIVAVTVDFKSVTESMNTLVGSNQTLYIAGKEGELLHAHSAERVSLSVRDSTRLVDLFPELLPLFDGSTTSVRLFDSRLEDGSRGIAYFENVALIGGAGTPYLVVGVSEPHETILAGVRSVRNSSALITLLLGLAAILLALSTSRYITNPIRKISTAVASFGSDERAVNLPVDRDDEIGLLARSFEAMEHQIQEQIQFLEDEERRQRTILDTAAEGIIVVDTDGRIETFNAAAERIFNVPASAAAGRHVTRFIPSIDLASSTIDGNEMRPPGVETTGLTVDARAVAVSVVWSSFEWRDEPKCTIFVADVTERKEAEEARKRLVRELESERKSLRELSTSLEARVKQRTAELERLNLELKSSNRELQEITTVASHDLQEPLRKLRSFADLLEAEYGDVLDENGRFYARRIYRLAERMARLLNDLMAFSGVTSHEHSVRKVDLHAVALDVVRSLEPAITKSGASVHVDDLPEVDAVPRQMHELLENLLENALMYSRPDVDSVICIRGSLEKDESGRCVCRIVVQDNGIGFDEKYVDRIFAPFERLNDRGPSEGTGMGLTICRRIAESHKGNITVHSRPGEGSTFIVTLPAEHGE